MRSGSSIFLVLVAVGCAGDSDGGVAALVEDLSPDEGFTYYVPPFEVPAGEEIQDCYFLAVPDLYGDGRDLWIDRFKMAQRDGSHHMNVFRVKTVLGLSGQAGDVVRGGECRNSVNWADWPLVVNSQESSGDDPVVDWRLPAGVAQRFRPGELLMVQTHYVNASAQTTPKGGEVKINFYLTATGSPIEMGTLFATQQSIRVCQSHPEATYDGTCAFPGNESIHIAAANGHFHARGERFRIYVWDGQSISRPDEEALCYESDQWDDPPMSIGMDEVVPAGGGIWWSCEYQWAPPGEGCDEVDRRDDQQAGDCCYTFGNSAESAEHCNVFLYYWPKVQDTDVFCN